MQRILIVDDELDLLWALDQRLSSEGYTVYAARDGVRALAMIRRQVPDLIVLDINMPRMSGNELYQRLRRMRSLDHVPILFLTVRNAVEERVRALNAGADGYLGKPFNLDELVARVRALLRRSERAENADVNVTPVLSLGRLLLDIQVRQVRIDGRVARLTPAEIDLLRHFMTHPGTIISTANLLNILHSVDAAGPGLVRWHIMNLRAKIEADPANPTFLQTIPRRGYILNPIALQMETD